jgi:hypothetical protein
MRVLSKALLVVGVLASASSQAAVGWSGCVTITGVNNQVAYNNQVSITVSPAFSCGGNALFTVGTQGVTAENITPFIAQGLTAMATGRMVQIYFDSTTCASSIIANGGYSGQC